MLCSVLSAFDRSLSERENSMTLCMKNGSLMAGPKQMDMVQKKDVGM